MAPATLRTVVRLWIPAACVLAITAAAAAGPAAAGGSPLLLRILTATVNTPDVRAGAALYRDALGYEIVAEGRVSPALARSWGAGAMAGREQALLRPASGEPVFLRLVAGTPVPGYEPLTSPGWNAVELLVEDPDRLSRRLTGTAFTHLGGPAFLAPDSSIRAAQYAGPAGEIFYFTADKGPRDGSTLARARSPVDRPFILVLAGRDAGGIAAFYRDTFALSEAFRTSLPVPVIARAQRRDPQDAYPLILLRLAAFSHSLEIDGYGERPPRPRKDGELPPGVALATFLVADLDALGPLPFLHPPRTESSAPYHGRRSATLRGPAGELIELVEERVPAR